MKKKRINVLSLRELFDKITDTHKNTIVSQLACTITLQMVVGLLIGFVAVILMFAIIMTAVTGASIYDDEMPLTLILIIMPIFVYLSLLVQMMVTTGSQKIASDDLFGYKTSFSVGFKFAFKNMGKLMITCIPYTIVMMLFIAVVFIIPIVIFFGVSIFNYASYDLVDVQTMGIMAIITMVIYILFLIFTFLVFSTIYSMVIPAVIFENKTGFKALKRSRELVKGKFWQCFFRLGICNLISQGISTSLLTVAAIIGGILFFVFNNSLDSESAILLMSMGANFIQYPVQIVIAATVTPLAAIFSMMLFYNRKMEKEGYDFEVNLFFMNKEKGSVENAQ